MITLSDKIYAINTIIALALIVAFAYGPWQRLLVDVVRQKLFELRDELFDLARDGKIAFDAEPYILIRTFLNGTIRFADRVSIYRILFLIPSLRRAEAPPIDRVFVEVEDQDLRKKLSDKTKRALRLIEMLVWLRSPLLVALSAVAVVFAPAIAMAIALSQRLRRRVRHVGAIVRRQIEREACFDQ